MSKEDKLENGGPSDGTPSDNAPEQATSTDSTTTEASTEMKWYVVHTYSGFEQKAKLALAERIRQYKMDAQFAELLIP